MPALPIASAQAPSIFLLDVLSAPEADMKRRFLFATPVADPVQDLL
jgi:hypothetical protein